MKTLVDQLSKYASYHRDRRNIATHFVGIPMILLSVFVLLSRPALPIAGLPASPGLLVGLIAGIYYFLLDRRYGAVMAAVIGTCIALGAWTATLSTQLWLGLGIGLFVVGWIIQFVGHYYEGKKPAFVDDLVGLVIGPLFVVAELGFLLSMRDEVRRKIEERVGPTFVRDLSVPASH